MAAEYRVTEKSFLGHAIRLEGETVEHDGEPGPNLWPLNEEAQAACDACASHPAKVEVKPARARRTKADTDAPGGEATDEFA